MLDATELRRRLVDAMAKHDPVIRPVDLAKACKVTAQGVNGWLRTGRIAKAHLTTIARVTGRPLEYYLGEESTELGQNYQLAEAEAIARLRNAHPDWRKYVLSLAMLDRAKQELMLATMREAAPDDYVAAQIGEAPHVTARKAKARP